MKIKAYSSSLVLSLLVSINDANILELIKKNNTEIKNLENQTLRSQLTYENFDIYYAPFFSADVSTEKDNTDTMVSPSQLSLDKKKYTAILGKNFSSGTQLSLEATQFDYRSGLTPALATTNYNQNYLAVGVEQSIYPNFLGSLDRAQMSSSFSQMQKEQLQVQADLIDLVKVKLANYWKAKSLQLQVEKNKELIEKYELLNKKILQKTRNGLSNPGEYEQAQAEIVQRRQNILDDSANLNIAIQQLREDLAIQPDQDLKIETNLKKIAPPTKANVQVENTMKYSLQNAKMMAAENAYDAAVKNNTPEISLYGKYTQQGLESSSSESIDEFNRGDKNKYLIGLKLNYTFGSDLNDINYRLRKQELEIEKDKTKKIKTDLKYYFDNLSQRVASAYNNMESAEQILKLRYEINKKIRTSYDQGRSDISILIDSYNKTTLAELNIMSAYSIYSQLNYEYQAQIK